MSDRRRRDNDVAGISDRRRDDLDRLLVRADEVIVFEEDDKRCHRYWDNDDVAGIGDNHRRRRVLDVDQVIIRADEVIIVDEDDRKKHRCHRRDRRGGFSWI